MLVGLVLYLHLRSAGRSGVLSGNLTFLEWILVRSVNEQYIGIRGSQTLRKSLKETERIGTVKTSNTRSKDNLQGV